MTEPVDDRTLAFNLSEIEGPLKGSEKRSNMAVLHLKGSLLTAGEKPGQSLGGH